MTPNLRPAFIMIVSMGVMAFTAILRVPWLGIGLIVLALLLDTCWRLYTAWRRSERDEDR